MLFVKPRQNTKWNDKWRTERDVPSEKTIMHKTEYPLDAAVE